MEQTPEALEIETLIRKVAEKEGLGLTENLPAIARAKARFFGVGEWHKCPCDRESDRACISTRCFTDIMRDGICHCNLYTREK